MIKKSFCLLLVFAILCLCLCGCAPDEGPLDGDPSSGAPSGAVTPSGSVNPDSSGTQEPTQPTEPEEDYHTVTVNLNDGSTPTDYRVKVGETFKQPSTPLYGNNVFLGWFSRGTEYDFSSPVTSDLVINALWEKVYSNSLYRACGGYDTITDGYKSIGGSLIMANTNQDFDCGTIEVTVNSPSKSDSGIIVCLNNNGRTTFWESGVSYYFFFVNLDGNAYLGKVDNGSWSAKKVVPIANYVQGADYTLKVELNGTDLYCYVNGQLYIAFSEYRFLSGGGFGIRTGASNVSFTDFKIDGKTSR